jgi:hypothetical protein
VAWYGHLKNGSLTQKEVGDTVQTGDYLGIVGSSGRSGGPHLHLELYDGARRLVDPYQGACNTFNSNSWWTSQRPYYDSGINAVKTGDARAESMSCPNPTITHIEDDFSPGDSIYFSTYYRDLLEGQASQWTIYQPDGSVFQRWTGVGTQYYAASSSWRNFKIGPVVLTGTWRFEVAFEGQTYQTFFNIGDPAYIRVTSPGAGEPWEPGSIHAIRWDDNLGGNVRLDLYRAGSYRLTIAKSIPSDGLHSWTVPGSLPASPAYQVRVVDLAHDAFYANSAYFTVGDPAVIDDVKTYLPFVLQEYEDSTR